MTFEQLKRKINTAGAGFVGMFMHEFLAKYPEYSSDSTNKAIFIRHIHEEYGENMGWTYDSTKTKCYALISIIENRRVLDALEHVVNCNEKKISPPTAIDNAMECIDMLAKGKLVLP